MNRCLILIVYKYMCVFTDKFLSLAAKKEKKNVFRVSMMVIPIVKSFKHSHEFQL